MHVLAGQRDDSIDAAVDRTPHLDKPVHAPGRDPGHRQSVGERSVGAGLGTLAAPSVRRAMNLLAAARVNLRPRVPTSLRSPWWAARSGLKMGLGCPQTPSLYGPWEVVS